jgi:hypothetical protein
VHLNRHTPIAAILAALNGGWEISLVGTEISVFNVFRTDGADAQRRYENDGHEPSSLPRTTLSTRHTESLELAFDLFHCAFFRWTGRLVETRKCEILIRSIACVWKRFRISRTAIEGNGMTLIEQESLV